MVERESCLIEPSLLDERIRVVVVAPDNGQRARLVSAVEVCAELDLIGVTSTDHDTLRLCPHIKPDVVLVVPQAADLDGPALAQDIRDRWSWVQVLVLSNSALGSLSREAVGETVDALYARRPDGLSWNGSGPRLRAYPDRALSRREWVVWRALKRGQDDAQIAERLAVNELTARFHVRNVLDKLGLTARQDVSVLEAGGA